MGVEEFGLDEFNIKHELDKDGGEAFVSKALHPRLGYAIFKIF